MSAPQTWRDKQAARPDPVQAAIDAFNAHQPPGYLYARMQAALEAAEAAEISARQCDQPGCEREASYGCPVDGGYRRTCYEHSTWAKL